MTDDEERAEFLDRLDREVQAGIDGLKLGQYQIFTRQIDLFFDGARETLDVLYKEYLNRDTDFETLKKCVLRIEFEYEKLKHDIAEAEEGDGVFITRHYLFEELEKEIAFYKSKIQSDIWAGSRGGELETVASEMPGVVVDLITNSGLLETQRDTTGRFKPNGGIKDTAIIQWIYDYSGYANELTAEIYTKFIYTTNKQKTIEDYMSRAKKKN